MLEHALHDNFKKHIQMPSSISFGVYVVTTVLPKPKPTATLPPPTAIAPKLKTPPTVTSTLIPTDNDNTTHSNLATDTDNTTHSTTNQTP